jgi:hypothetical protein
LVFKEEKISYIQTKLVGIHGRVQQLIDQLQKNKERITEYNQSPEENAELIDNIERDSLEILSRISMEVSEVKDSSDISVVMDSISNVGSYSTSKLLDNNFEHIYSIFSDLSSAQIGALGNIFCAITLYYCVIGIASGYYGDILIVKLKLEEKKKNILD